MTKNRLLVVLIILLIFGISIFVYLIFNLNRLVVVKTSNNTNDTVIKPTAIPTTDPLASFSILVLGYGGGKHEGGLLTDTMLVAKIEPKNNLIKLVSIPRDIWVPLPVNGDDIKNFKINAAYAIGSDNINYPNKRAEFTGKAGGGEMAKYIVSKVVGFDIDYFVALNFNGFIKLIDILGGVEVTNLKSFTDPMYPIEININDNCGKTEDEVAAISATLSGERLEKEFSCRYEVLNFQKGILHMDGLTALKYSRSRHSIEDGGDFNRSFRQKQVIMAIKNKIISIGFIPKIIPFINTLSGNLITDINIDRMGQLISLADVISNSKIDFISLSDNNVLTESVSIDRQYILIPRAGEDNWTEVHSFIDNNETITPTLYN